MSTLQVSNLHFESTANNRLQFIGSNTIALTVGGNTQLTINSSHIVVSNTINSSQRINASGNANITQSLNANAFLLNGQTLSIQGGYLINVRILTTGTQYTTPSNCTKIYVECLGGGGGGSANSGNYAGSGSAGAYCAKTFTVTPSTIYNYVIGSGGSGAGLPTPSIGGTGGQTTFTVSGVTITAGGGQGGQNGSIVSNGGTATGGDINLRGTAGNLSVYRAAGAPSFFGGGGSIDAASPSAASTGGGGGCGRGSGSVGGNGGAGLIRIWEFTS